MKIYDAITGTIIYKTGIIPSRSLRVIAHHRKRLNNNIDTHIYMVQDGYGDTYRVVFHVYFDVYGEIAKYTPLDATIINGGFKK